ncbi:MAG: hypothetical protein K1X86_02860 [Ignavibacteria bacterium]|nr:hypothetical protein [Ignavibacteria bacterium]
MKKFLPLILLILIIVYSCGKKTQNASIPDLSQANNMSIMFKMDFDSTGKMKIKNVPITEPKKMNELKTLLNSEPFPYLYCASSGAMNFYKDSTLLYSFAFNTEKDLRHIAYTYNNKLTAVTLSEENAKFLDSFKQ